VPLSCRTKSGIFKVKSKSGEETGKKTMRTPVLLVSLGLILGLIVLAEAGQKSQVQAHPSKADLDLWEKQLVLPPNVAARLDWARKSLVPSGHKKLERLALATAPAIASGTPFNTIRKDTELDRIFQNAGLSAMDISEAAFIVMAMATKDMDDDIRIVMAEIKAITAAKQKLRDQIKDLNEWISEEMSKAKGGAISSDIANAQVSGKPSRTAPRPQPAGAPAAYVSTLEKASSPVIHLEYVKAPAVLPIPPRSSGVRAEGLKSLLNDLKGKLDGMNEMSEMTSLRLQMTMDRRSKFIETLSNIMKKIGTTQDSLVQNLK